MRLGDGGLGRAFRRSGWVMRAAALAAAVLFLGACASGAQVGGKGDEPPKTPVVLRSMPRHAQLAPLTEWVYLWDRPGGPSARAVRVARVPSGTEGTVVESEAPRSPASDFLDAIGAENLMRQPVRWVKVATPRGEGWVRGEFVEPR